MASQDYRIEHDSMGELQVPAEALWGAQTQRAVENFPISGQPMPRGFIRALGLVKAAAAELAARAHPRPRRCPACAATSRSAVESIICGGRPLSAPLPLARSEAPVIWEGMIDREIITIVPLAVLAAVASGVAVLRRHYRLARLAQMQPLGNARRYSDPGHPCRKVFERQADLPQRGEQAGHRVARRAAEHGAVEVQHAVQVGHPQHDVVELEVEERQRARHDRRGGADEDRGPRRRLQRAHHAGGRSARGARYTPA